MKLLPLLFLLVASCHAAPVVAAESFSWGALISALGDKSKLSRVVIEPLKDSFPSVARVTIFNGENYAGKDPIIQVGVEDIFITLSVDSTVNLGEPVPDVFEVLDLSPGYMVDNRIIKVDEDKAVSFEIYAIPMG